MRRFIRYLYEYEQEKKMRNVGFVKVEQDVDQCVIHVHGKGFRMEERGTPAITIHLDFGCRRRPRLRPAISQ